MEELASAIQNAGFITVKGDRCDLAPGFVNFSGLQLPSTVQGAITSRIDSLSAQEQLRLKIASVVGATFDRRVIEAIHPIPGDRPQVADHLLGLERQQLTVRESPDDPDRHRFKSGSARETASPSSAPFNFEVAVMRTGPPSPRKSAACARPVAGSMETLAGFSDE